MPARRRPAAGNTSAGRPGADRLVLLLVLNGLRDKMIFLAARGEQYLPALIFFAVLPFVDMIIALKLLIVVVWVGAGVLQVRQALRQRRTADGEQHAPRSPSSGSSALHYRDFPATSAPRGSQSPGPRRRHDGRDRPAAGPAVLDQPLGHARGRAGHGLLPRCSSRRRSRWRCRWSGTSSSPHDAASCSLASRRGRLRRRATCPRRGCSPRSSAACCSSRCSATCAPTWSRSCRRCASTPATGPPRCGLSRPAREDKLNEHLRQGRANRSTSYRRSTTPRGRRSRCSTLVAWRTMHSQGRGLFSVLLKHLPDIDAYTVREAEFVCNSLIGFNFGDGHLHDDRLIAADPARCRFAPGEFVVVWVESQPVHATTRSTRSSTPLWASSSAGPGRWPTRSRSSRGCPTGPSRRT